MLNVSAVGRVTTDFELQTGAKASYVRFSLAVNKGFGDNERAVYLQCVLFDKAAEHIINAKVKKGSLIWVAGDLDLDEYERAGGTKDKALKVSVHDWGYIPAGKSRNADAPQESAPLYSAHHVAEIDGTREPLP